MELKDLYARYGELGINAELIQSEMNQIKGKIGQALSVPVSGTPPEDTDPTGENK